MTTESAPLPESIPAAVYQSQRVVTIEQRPLAEPNPAQVVVEVSHCGICGSDLHLIDEGWGQSGDVLGHEWSGVVRSVGDSVVEFQPGDRVIGADSPRCGVCAACVAKKPSQCEDREPTTGHFDGAFATHVLADANTLLHIPDELGLREAALAEPLAVALHAITRSGIEQGNSAIVFGAGPIGALIAAVLIQDGHQVTVVEPAEQRQELARGIGAAAVLRPEELPSFDMGQVDTLAEDAVHVVFECSGRRDAMESGFQQLRRGGVLVLVGTGIDRPRFDPNRMILLELTVRGAFVYDADGFDRALEMLSSGTLPTDLLIDQAEYDLTGIAEAVDKLVRGEHSGKVMITPGGADHD